MSEETETANGENEAANEAGETQSSDAESDTKRKVNRNPLWVFVPQNIHDVEAVDPEVPEAPEPDEDGKKPQVEITAMPAAYHSYVIPPGPGQKKAVNAILAKHNVDLRNVGRVKMFLGEKTFEIEPQYNIRFK